MEGEWIPVEDVIATVLPSKDVIMVEFVQYDTKGRGYVVSYGKGTKSSSKQAAARFQGQQPS